MDIISKIKNIVVFISLLLLSAGTAHSVENGLCSAFEQTASQSMINNMLQAAKFERLYRIKKDSSKMGFCVESAIGLVKGNFNQFEGGIALTGMNSQTMVSLDTNSLNTDNTLIEGLLRSDDFLDVVKHPNLVFISTGFHWISPVKAVIKGQLTMRGVTRDVAFYVDMVEADSEIGDSKTILIKATTTVSRSEFGMSTMPSLISDKVNLCMMVEAERYTEI